MTKREKSLMGQLIEERGIKDIVGVQALVERTYRSGIWKSVESFDSVELDESISYRIK